jgi:MarR family transcriptional regulator, 2-MHQ and catechol-resistance regulon repressor
VTVTTDFHDPRLTALGLFAEAYVGLAGRFTAQVAEHGLSPIEFEVLLRLVRSPERRLRMTDLASQTSLSTSGVTRVVDRMDRHGLICREACPTDRRSFYAVITEAGVSRLEKIMPGHLQLIDEWFIGRLTGEQFAGMQEALRALRDAVYPNATAGAEDVAPAP